MKHLLLLALSLPLFSSCARVFYSEDATPLSRSHELIAILPPTVTIAPRFFTDPQAMKAHQIAESQNFQREIHAWMLKRKRQGKVKTEIMNIETSNARLLAAGYPDKPMTPQEIGALLGVDGVVTSSFALSKPFSDGAAIVLDVLQPGQPRVTNQIQVTLAIHDCPNNKLIWNFRHVYSGGLGSTPAGLVNSIMRKASRKMPYSRK